MLMAYTDKFVHFLCCLREYITPNSKENIVKKTAHCRNDLVTVIKYHEFFCCFVYSTF